MARTPRLAPDGERDARTLATIGTAHAGVSVPQPTWGALATAAEAQIEAFLDGARQHGVELQGERCGAGALRRARVREPRAHQLPAGRAREHGVGLLARRRREPELFDAVAEEAARRAASSNHLSPPAPRVPLRGPASRRRLPRRACDEAQAPGRLAEWNSQALANLAWAFAKAGAPPLFDAVAAECGGGANGAQRAELEHGVGIRARARRRRSDEIAAEAKARVELSSQGLATSRGPSPPAARGAVAL